MVHDDISGEPLEGVVVFLGDTIEVTKTGPGGLYEFVEIEAGRYKITATHPEYNEEVVFDAWVRNGKVFVQEFTLTSKQKGDIQPKIIPNSKLSELGSMVITEEQLNRFPATFQDPARVVILAPDLSLVNDRNNRVSARGISPDYNTWRLEDVEILNPNHLSNAGTYADQPAATGGGLNMLSAQVVDRSHFLYGDFSAEYGNSIGGIFDMQLRKGVNDRRQHMAQASLLGFDFAMEGPFEPGGDASYIFNYRYSLGGLLSVFNVPVGQTSRGFQDLSFNLNKPLGTKANVSLFGLGGLSSEQVEAKLLEESGTVKDRSDRTYKGRMGVIGSKLDWRVGKGILKASAAFSTSGHELSQTTFQIPSRGFFGAGYRDNSTDQVRSILSTNTSYRFKLLNSIFNLGSMYNYYSNRYEYSYGDFSSTDYGVHYVNPYLNLEVPISKNILIESGLNINMAKWYVGNRQLRQNGFTIELFDKAYEDRSFDPRLKLVFGSPNNSNVYLSFGRYSQLLDYSNFFFVYQQSAGEHTEINREYRLQQSNRYILGATGRNLAGRVSIELFFNDYPEIFSSNSGGFNYAQITTLNELEVSSAQVYGISIMGQRSFSDNWYSHIGGSAFNSTWGSDEPNRFNSRFNFNFSGGKAWDYQRNDAKESLHISLNGIFQEGLKEPGGPSLVSTNNDFFYRLDFRIQLIRAVKERTTSISLDLQNITFRKNDAFRINDPFQFELAIERQRGFTPLLAYRIEF